MTQKKLDQIAGACLVIFGVMVYFIVIPWQVPGDRMGLSSAFFPKLSVVTLGLFGAFLFIRSTRDRRLNVDAPYTALNRTRLKRAATIFLMMVGFVFLLTVAGYMIAAPVSMAALFFYSGQTRLRIVLPLIVITPAVIWILFEYGMDIMLPRGLLF